MFLCVLEIRTLLPDGSRWKGERQRGTINKQISYRYLALVAFAQRQSNENMVSANSGLIHVDVSVFFYLG